MIHALHVLCGRLVNLGYQPGFLSDPLETDLSSFPGRVLDHVVMGVDSGIGAVPYGLVTTGPEGTILSIRGTQTPNGSWSEWVRNFEAELVKCPFGLGQWHAGIGNDYLGLTIDGQPIAKALLGRYDLIVSGHSKGGPLALYAASEIGAQAAVCFASPKPGDGSLGTWIKSRVGEIDLYANPKDVVPHTPLTLPPFEDYVFPCDLTLVDATTLVPAIASDWGAQHNLEGCYLRVLSSP